MCTKTRETTFFCANYLSNIKSFINHRHKLDPNPVQNGPSKFPLEIFTGHFIIPRARP